jgi:hypothetical protein
MHPQGFMLPNGLASKTFKGARQNEHREFDSLNFGSSRFTAHCRWQLTDLQSSQEPARLRQRFVVFRFWIRIRNDASTNVKVGATRLMNRRSNDDTELALAIETEITKSAGVRTARDWLQLVDDFHRTNLRRASNAAARKARRER